MRFGLYQVSGQHGTDYTVECYRDGQGRRVVSCTCPTRDGIPCKHAAAALQNHAHLVFVRRLIGAQTETLPAGVPAEKV